MITPACSIPGAYPDGYGRPILELGERDLHQRCDEHRVHLRFAMQDLACNREREPDDLYFHSREVCLP